MPLHLVTRDALFSLVNGGVGEPRRAGERASGAERAGGAGWAAGEEARVINLSSRRLRE